MTAVKPLDVVKSFYETIGRGDAPAALGLLDNSVQWTEAEGSPYFSGTWIGPDAVRKNLFERLGDDWNKFTVAADSFVADGSIVAAFGHYTGVFKATGKTLNAPFVHRWEVIDGKITNFRQYTDTGLLRAVLP